MGYFTRSTFKHYHRHLNLEWNFLIYDNSILHTTSKQVYLMRFLLKKSKTPYTVVLQTTLIVQIQDTSSALDGV